MKVNIEDIHEINRARSHAKRLNRLQDDEVYGINNNSTRRASPSRSTLSSGRRRQGTATDRSATQSESPRPSTTVSLITPIPHHFRGGANPPRSPLQPAQIRPVRTTHAIAPRGGHAVERAPSVDSGYRRAQAPEELRGSDVVEDAAYFTDNYMDDQGMSALQSEGLVLKQRGLVPLVAAPDERLPWGLRGPQLQPLDTHLLPAASPPEPSRSLVRGITGAYSSVEVRNTLRGLEFRTRACGDTSTAAIQEALEALGGGSRDLRRGGTADISAEHTFAKLVGAKTAVMAKMAGSSPAPVPPEEPPPPQEHHRRMTSSARAKRKDNPSPRGLVPAEHAEVAAERGGAASWQARPSTTVPGHFGGPTSWWGGAGNGRAVVHAQEVLDTVHRTNAERRSRVPSVEDPLADALSQVERAMQVGVIAEVVVGSHEGQNPLPAHPYDELGIIDCATSIQTQQRAVQAGAGVLHGEPGLNGRVSPEDLEGLDAVISSSGVPSRLRILGRLPIPVGMKKTKTRMMVNVQDGDSQKLYHEVLVPAYKPGTRDDVGLLHLWLRTVLAKLEGPTQGPLTPTRALPPVLGGGASAPSAPSPAPSLPSPPPPKLEFGGPDAAFEPWKQQFLVYTTAMLELIRHVWVHCNERGRLLFATWRQLVRLINLLVEPVGGYLQAAGAVIKEALGRINVLALENESLQRALNDVRGEVQAARDDTARAVDTKDKISAVIQGEVQGYAERVRFLEATLYRFLPHWQRYAKHPGLAQEMDAAKQNPRAYGVERRAGDWNRSLSETQSAELARAEDMAALTEMQRDVAWVAAAGERAAGRLQRRAVYLAQTAGAQTGHGPHLGADQETEVRGMLGVLEVEGPAVAVTDGERCAALEEELARQGAANERLREENARLRAEAERARQLAEADRAGLVQDMQMEAAERARKAVEGCPNCVRHKGLLDAARAEAREVYGAECPSCAGMRAGACSKCCARMACPSCRAQAEEAAEMAGRLRRMEELTRQMEAALREGGMGHAVDLIAEQREDLIRGIGAGAPGGPELIEARRGGGVDDSAGGGARAGGGPDDGGQSAGAVEGSVVCFAASKVAVTEARGRVEVGVMRVEGTRGRAAVRVRTRGGTATSGADFVPLDDVLRWEDGEGGVHRVSIQLLSDGYEEDDESFFVELLPPEEGPDSSGCTIGRVATCEVVIQDSDGCEAEGSKEKTRMYVHPAWAALLPATWKDARKRKVIPPKQLYSMIVQILKCKLESNQEADLSGEVPAGLHECVAGWLTGRQVGYHEGSKDLAADRLADLLVSLRHYWRVQEHWPLFHLFTRLAGIYDPYPPRLLRNALVVLDELSRSLPRMDTPAKFWKTWGSLTSSEVLAMSTVEAVGMLDVLFEGAPQAEEIRIKEELRQGAAAMEAAQGQEASLVSFAEAKAKQAEPGPLLLIGPLLEFILHQDIELNNAMKAEVVESFVLAQETVNEELTLKEFMQVVKLMGIQCSHLDGTSDAVLEWVYNQAEEGRRSEVEECGRVLQDYIGYPQLNAPPLGSSKADAAKDAKQRRRAGKHGFSQLPCAKKVTIEE